LKNAQNVFGFICPSHFDEQSDHLPTTSHLASCGWLALKPCCSHIMRPCTVERGFL